MRNPWGKKEWTGNWSDDSNSWTPELKKQAGFDNSANDGIFFMEFKDFIKYFTDFQVCMYKDNYVYSSIKYAEKDLKKKSAYFKMKVSKSGHYYITSNQPSNKKTFKYLPSKIVVGKHEGHEYSFEGAKQKAERELWISGDFKAGVEYVIYTRVQWDSSSKKKVVVSAYGEGKAEFQKVEKKSVSDFVKSCYLSKARNSTKMQDYAKHGHPEVKKCVEMHEKEGFGYLYIKNGGTQKFHGKVTLNNMQGLKFRKPLSGNVIQIDVNPHDEFIVPMNVDSKGYAFSSSESFNFA